MGQKIGIDGFLGRWIFALLLVLGTYNPSGYSYFSWAFNEEAAFGPVLTIVGLVLLIFPKILFPFQCFDKPKSSLDPSIIPRGPLA